MKEINSFDACERNRTGNARSCKDLSAVRDGNGRIETTREKQTYDWELRDGKLAKLTIADPDASIDCGYNPDIGQLLGFLAQKYGKPSERKVTYQNGFGATWDLSRSTWDMPDGTTIIAGEMLGRQCVPGRRRELVIIFMSGELVKNEERNKQNKANPFDK